MENLLITLNTKLALAGFQPVTLDTASSIKSLLTWTLGLIGAGLAIYGLIQLSEGLSESNGTQRRNGLLTLLGGVIVGLGGVVLVNVIQWTPPS